MSVQYSINGVAGVVTTTLAGCVTQEELLQLFRTLINDSRFDTHFSQLMQISAGSVAHLCYADLEGVTRADPFSDTSRVAIVASSEVDYGIARMYQMIRGGKVLVFRTFEEARDFLGL